MYREELDWLDHSYPKLDNLHCKDHWGIQLMRVFYLVPQPHTWFRRHNTLEYHVRPTLAAFLLAHQDVQYPWFAQQ